MKQAIPRMRDCAQRLIACEATGTKSTDPKSPSIFLVCEKVRPHLATLMGNAGFRALLSRALALASAQVPALKALHVKPDGSLDGMDKFETHADSGEMLEGAVVLLAELLGLLAAFIGENLTLQLVREVWPKLPLAGLEIGNGASHEKAE